MSVKHDSKTSNCSHCRASKKECADEGKKRGGACCNRCYDANGRGR